MIELTSLPGNRQNVRRVSRLRRRSRYSVETRRRGQAENMQWQTKEAAKAKDRIE